MFVHPSKRYRLYIDETGTQTLKATHEDRFLCLTGVIMRQDVHDGPFTEGLAELKARFFGHAPNYPIILHRKEMVRGEPPFQRLKDDPEFRVGFESAWIDLVANSNYIAIAGAIDKIAHREKYRRWQHDPYHYCLEILVERFVRWLTRNRFVGDVLIESRDKGADKRLKNAYRHFFHHGNDHVSAHQAQRVLLSREIKFGEKVDDIAGHQLADSLAYPALRFIRELERAEPAPAGFGKQIVQVLIERRFARCPKTGVIRGWGHKWLPE